MLKSLTPKSSHTQIRLLVFFTGQFQFSLQQLHGSVWLMSEKYKQYNKYYLQTEK